MQDHTHTTYNLTDIFSNRGHFFGMAELFSDYCSLVLAVLLPVFNFHLWLFPTRLFILVITETLMLSLSSDV